MADSCLNMLPEENRLKKTKDIEWVFRAGNGHKEDFLFLKLAKNNLRVSRFAFIVSKKIAKKSVVRNKIKRLLREAVRKKLSETKVGFDVVVVALGGIEKDGFQKINAKMEKLFKKTKLI